MLEIGREDDAMISEVYRVVEMCMMITRRRRRKSGLVLVDDDSSVVAYVKKSPT